MNIVMEECNGVGSCSIIAKNTPMGGDPCAGTFKYFTATYECINTGPAAAGRPIYNHIVTETHQHTRSYCLIRDAIVNL